MKNFTSLLLVLVAALSFGQWPAPGLSKSQGDARYLLPSVDVRNYGATGNGITDDTAAIAAATTVANAINVSGSYGCRVTFRPGTYSVSSSLVMNSGVYFVGNGMENTIIRLNSSLAAGRAVVETTAFSTCTGTSVGTGAPDRCGLWDITIDGGNDTLATGLPLGTYLVVGRGINYYGSGGVFHDFCVRNCSSIGFWAELGGGVATATDGVELYCSSFKVHDCGSTAIMDFVHDSVWDRFTLFNNGGNLSAAGGCPAGITVGSEAYSPQSEIAVNSSGGVDGVICPGTSYNAPARVITLPGYPTSNALSLLGVGDGDLAGCLGIGTISTGNTLTAVYSDPETYLVGQLPASIAAPVTDSWVFTLSGTASTCTVTVAFPVYGSTLTQTSASIVGTASAATVQATLNAVPIIKQFGGCYVSGTAPNLTINFYNPIAPVGKDVNTNGTVISETGAGGTIGTHTNGTAAIPCRVLGNGYIDATAPVVSCYSDSSGRPNFVVGYGGSYTAGYDTPVVTITASSGSPGTCVIIPRLTGRSFQNGLLMNSTTHLPIGDSSLAGDTAMGTVTLAVTCTVGSGAYGLAIVNASGHITGTKWGTAGYANTSALTPTFAGKTGGTITPVLSPEGEINSYTLAGITPTTGLTGENVAAGTRTNLSYSGAVNAATGGGTMLSNFHIWGGRHQYGLRVIGVNAIVLSGEIEGASEAEIDSEGNGSQFSNMYMFDSGNSGYTFDQAGWNSLAQATTQAVGIQCSGHTVSSGGANIFTNIKMIGMHGGAIVYRGANGNTLASTGGDVMQNCVHYTFGGAAYDLNYANYSSRYSNSYDLKTFVYSHNQTSPQMVMNRNMSLYPGVSTGEGFDYIGHLKGAPSSAYTNQGTLATLNSGTYATCALPAGNDHSGTFSVITTASPPVTGTPASLNLATISFKGSYKVAPRIILFSPASGTAVGLANPQLVATSITTTGFTITVPGGMTASTTYYYSYFIEE